MVSGQSWFIAGCGGLRYQVVAPLKISWGKAIALKALTPSQRGIWIFHHDNITLSSDWEGLAYFCLLVGTRTQSQGM